MLYVERLIAPGVINTMPLGRPSAPLPTTAMSSQPSAPTPALRGASSWAAAADGVDLDAITAELEREGVRAFCDSYAELLRCIEGKRGALTAVS